MSEPLAPAGPARGWLACYGVTLLVMMLFLLPVGSTEAAYLRPMVPLILVYVLTAAHEIEIPLPAIAALGLVQDVTTGGILGLNVIVLIIARLTLADQQTWLTGRSFWIGWLGFLPVALTAAGLSWALAGLHAGALHPVGPVLGQTLMTAAVYPAFAALFGRLVKAR
ncbi:rod shape-determining protein MreD [Rhodothalassium salexigens DSM 2132]|uniref:Rod shape-determining protein MreD n=1 Tax=Rhodothalassium salexigens DSM 2132 TaxID=1188247 RepID=A0A4R2P9Q6_RHOSA|nr:hypothetical protein [Rhodothalassium salexigens]MBB4212591.1 cell shape-determining protein MreD [Rhodothalassium salexigens DSM 2132]MBK1639650.1 hypothetical protein [Rhodothalassium salexigens DSM 2132]TCP30811.1 rod shape-determining protein MreD [Rhodothalassium salexigens DSM 2132]